MIIKYYKNPDNTVAYEFLDDNGYCYESGGLVDENSIELEDEDEYQDELDRLELLRLSNIDDLQSEWEDAQAALLILKTSARAKLIAGDPLTEEEANLVMGIFGEE